VLKKNLPSITDIKDYGVFNKMTPILMGVEKHKKYFVETDDGRMYFLRIAEFRHLTQIKRNYEVNQRLFAAGVPMPRPIAFGRCREGVYTLYEWVESQGFNRVRESLQDSELYSLGKKSGSILYKFHNVSFASLPNPPVVKFKNKYYVLIGILLNWLILAISKKRRWPIYIRLTILHKIKPQSLNADNIFKPFQKYIKQNFKLLSSVSLSILHGDYAMHNLIIQDTDKLLVVDFTPLSVIGYVGDSLYDVAYFSYYTNEFNILNGFFHEYFKGNPPLEAWRRIAFYISIIACRNNDKSNIGYRGKYFHNARALYYYDNMRREVPLWYREKGESPDDVKMFKHLGCPYTENAVMSFRENAGGEICIFCCLEAADGAPAVPLSDTPAETVARYWTAQSEMLEENIKHSPLTLAEPYERSERVHTAFCVRCAHYQEKSWSNKTQIHLIELCLLSLNYLDKALEIILYAQKNRMIAPNAKLRVICAKDEPHPYEQRILDIASGWQLEFSAKRANS